MIKTKWFYLTTNLTLKDLAEKLLSRQAFKGAAIGFEVIEVQKNGVQAKFIEEIIDNEWYVDPFGDEIVNTIKRFSVFEFMIIPTKRGQFLLRMTNPPRSLKSFVANMVEILGFGFSIAPVRFDVLGLFRHFKATSFGSNFTLKKVKMSAIQLSDSAIAKMEVVSKKDAYQDVKSVLSIENAVLDRATIGLNSDSITSTEFDIAMTGVVSCEPDLLDRLLPFFQKYLKDNQRI